MGRVDEARARLRRFLALRRSRLRRRCMRVAIGNAPDRARAVVADQQGAVMRDRDRHRPSPHLAPGRDETGHEVLRIAPGNAPENRYEDDLVAGKLTAIPRAVLAHERTLAVRGGEL